MNRFSDFLSSKLPFYYGYLIVVVAVLAQVCASPGQTFAVAAFTPYLQESLGLSSSKLAAAYMLGTLLAAIPLVAIGPLSDRFGLRGTTACVAIALAGACFLASRVTGFASLLVAFMLLRFLGQGALVLLSGNIVSMWFQTRLGTVTSVMNAGGAAAFAIVPLVLIGAIQGFGWRMTYVALGMFILLSLVPLLVLTLRNRPEDLGQFPDGLRIDAETAGLAAAQTPVDLTLPQALRDRTFWILGGGMAVWGMIGTGLVFYALPIFQQYGVAPEQSKMLFTTLSLSMLVAQVVGGVLADRNPMHGLLCISFVLLAAGVAVIPLTSSVWHVHIFAGLFGLGQGLTHSVSSTMWVRYYGRQHLGKIRGTVWCAMVAGSGLGPFVLGIIVDTWGSFAPGIWLYVGLLLPLAPLSLLATKPRVAAPSVLPLSRAA
ncbi:MAG: MFS transporter [Planctomycetales bacterium]|nr:MFS transporter [Planctomycetales bacterium]